MTAVIGVTSCRKQLGLYSYHATGHQYVKAAAHAGIPMILPSCNQVSDMQTLLSKLDGILFTGSHSNVEPHNYSGSPSKPGTLHDSERDSFTLPLIRMAIEQGIPVLCICRGFQEMNVAFGGSLHQHLDEIPNLFPHKELDTDNLSIKYQPRHNVSRSKHGLLKDIGLPENFLTNSLHNQGIERIADNLSIEATADDNLIEAITLPNSKGFNLGVQWHPEFNFNNDANSLLIFNAFAKACNDFAAK